MAVSEWSPAHRRGAIFGSAQIAKPVSDITDNHAWTSLGVVQAKAANEDYWECPDLFPLLSSKGADQRAARARAEQQQILVDQARQRERELECERQHEREREREREGERE